MLELDVSGRGRKREGKELRKAVTLSMDPDRLVELQAVADSWGISLSKFLERAALYYIQDLEKDPAKIKPPE